MGGFIGIRISHPGVRAEDSSKVVFNKHKAHSSGFKLIIHRSLNLLSESYYTRAVGARLRSGLVEILGGYCLRVETLIILNNQAAADLVRVRLLSLTVAVSLLIVASDSRRYSEGPTQKFSTRCLGLAVFFCCLFFVTVEWVPFFFLFECRMVPIVLLVLGAL